MTAREFFTFSEWLRRFDATVVYVRSFFDDPVVPGKGSMARLSAYTAMAAGVWMAKKTVEFAFAALAQKSSESAMLAILAGLATTLLGTVCFGLLRRTTPSGVTETIDDVATQNAQSATTQTTVKTETAT